MGVLKNPKHERFSQELAKPGATQGKAYELAGYKPDSGAASRLSGNVSVQARVQEIVGNAAERAEVDVAYVIGGIRKVTEICADDSDLEKFNPPSALKGYELLGKHLCMFEKANDQPQTVVIFQRAIFAADRMVGLVNGSGAGAGGQGALPDRSVLPSGSGAEEG